MDDDSYLSNAELIVDANRGIYAPQVFANDVDRSLFVGVRQEVWDDLSSGPDSESYWDSWAELTDGCTVNRPKLGECFIHQDGDIWCVPKES